MRNEDHSFRNFRFADCVQIWCGNFALGYDNPNRERATREVSRSMEIKKVIALDIPDRIDEAAAI
jgi:hypothetical protein